MLDAVDVDGYLVKKVVRCMRYNGEKMDPTCQEIGPNEQYVASL